MYCLFRSHRWHLYVQKYYVRLHLCRHLHSLLSVRSFSDHLHAFFRVEDLGYALTEESVIVHQEYLDTVAPCAQRRLLANGKKISIFVPLPSSDLRFRVPPRSEVRSLMEASPAPFGRAASFAGSNPRPLSSIVDLAQFSLISTSIAIVLALECVTAFLIPSRRIKKSSPRTWDVRSSSSPSTEIEARTS